MAKTLKSTPYPAERPGQRYKRTGKLASSWFAKKSGGASWVVGNSQIYASYVVSDEQAWMHQDRWWIASEIIRDNVKVGLIERLTKKIRDIWDG